MTTDVRELAARSVPKATPERVAAWEEWKTNYLNTCIDGWIQQGSTREQIEHAATQVIVDLSAVDALPWMPLGQALAHRASAYLGNAVLVGEERTRFTNALRTAETATREEQTLSTAYTLGISMQQAANLRDKAEAHYGREARTAGKVALYRHFDVDGVLLYIGIANEPTARAEQHRKSSKWWRFVASTDVEWHTDRAAADLAERASIATECPVFNGTHNRAGREAAMSYLWAALEGAPS